ncbi:hypothetical protein ACQY1Q_05995 [Tenacibaculum sp. TC6]|uniref:hypothetical protein n=1 Tax=Tenacibaculum sp. TC6 TaxID=3423223 RepID=UPI003D35D635
MEHILQEIREERSRQNEKWGEQNHNLVEWMAILTEEHGEVGKEAVELHFGAQQFNPSLEENKEAFKERLEAYRTELIQVAAVAVSMIESVERNEFKWVN